MTTRDTLRVEQVYFENLKRTMNELAAKKSELDGTMQTIAENAVAADENIIMLYKNLCEAWIEAENLFKKVDTDTQAITERIDSLEKEFNEKIDEVNNYIVSITRALDERLTQAEEDIDALEGRMDTAEADIDALEGRMDTAEGDIDALEGRMTTAEGDIDALEGRMTAAETAIDNLESGSLVYDTVTNQVIASVPDGQYNGEVVSLVAGIEPVQSGSGDPSPTNVRPINGFDNAVIDRVGKNFFKPTTGTYFGVTITVNTDGGIKLNGTATQSYNFYSTISIKKGTYTISCPYSGTLPTTAAARVQVYNLEYNILTGITNTESQSAAKAVILPNDMNLDCRIRIDNGFTYNNVILYPQLEYGNTATTYEPYTGTTYPITFPSEAGTVYGGTLDVTNGVLRVDMAIVDLGTLNWEYNATYGFYANLPSNAKPYLASVMANAICSQYKTVAANQITSGSTDKSIGIGANYIYVSDSAYTDKTSFKTAMDGVQLCYELVTPTTYQLTPTEVRLLLGLNNVWADTGDIVSMEYPCDLKLYIDKKISQITPTNVSTTRTEHDFSAAQEVFDALQKTEITDAEEPEEER